MNYAVLAFALFSFAAAPALAQQSEMDRAEQEMRSSMAPAGVAVERVAPDEIRLRVPSDITFDFNRAEVRAQFMPRIRDLARTLANYPDLTLQIVGHADAIGSDAYNQELSERRARSVGAALIDQGVQWQRVGASGRGEWEPVATNASDWGRAQNRRVEISVTRGGGRPK